MFNTHASYRIVYETDKAVFIIDEDYGDKSVTNDAEYVCEKLSTGRRNKRIIYRDSDRKWEEIKHNGFKFTCFRMIIGTDEIIDSLKVAKEKC